MDYNGIACLSEYGLELTPHEEVSSKFLSNVMWMAPEVISIINENKRITMDDGKRADVYSFAMVMFQVRCPTVYRIGSALNF